MQSMSTLLREWDTDRVLLGTRPSWGGECSVVRTRHQPGRSPDLSNSSTVWPDWMLNSPTDPATKSCRTTVCSQPPDNYRERERDTAFRFLKKPLLFSRKKGCFVKTVEKKTNIKKHLKNNIVKYYYYLKYLLSILIFFKMQFIPVMQSWIFSIITPVFSVTRSFTNHSNMLIIINVKNSSLTVGHYELCRGDIGDSLGSPNHLWL